MDREREREKEGKKTTAQEANTQRGKTWKAGFLHIEYKGASQSSTDSGVHNESGHNSNPFDFHRRLLHGVLASQLSLGV